MAELIWKDPEIYRIQIEIPDNPLRSVNVYVLQSIGCTLVVDAGLDTPACKKQLWAELDKLEIYPEQTMLFLTHFHADHIGQVWEFAKRGIRIGTSSREEHYFYEHPADEVLLQMNSHYLQEGFPQDLLEESNGRWKTMPMPKLNFSTMAFEDGHGFFVGREKVQVISVPGHTPGNAVLYLPERKLLFSGDHVLFDITPNIGVWPGVEYSLADYLSSLDKIDRLEIQKTFPAHREAEGDIHTRIAEIKKHHQKRLDEVSQKISRNPGISIYELAGQLQWSARGAEWSQFSSAQRWFAMAETMAHVIELNRTEQ